jgi:hypothetical protein
VWARVKTRAEDEKQQAREIMQAGQTRPEQAFGQQRQDSSGMAAMHQHVVRTRGSMQFCAAHSLAPLLTPLSFSYARPQKLLLVASACGAGPV